MTILEGWQEDLSPADWVRASWEDLFTVSRFVPRCFDAYLRILWPAGILEDIEAPVPSFTPVRWATVAAWSGLPLHRRAGWASITVGPEPLPDDPPFTDSPGGPSPGWDDALADVLAEDRDDRERYWMLKGLPSDDPPGSIPAHIRDSPTVPDVDRFACHLFRVPLRRAVDGIYCWPEDRSWFLGLGGQELPWTYLGGTTDFIERVHADDRLETLLVGVEEPTGYVEAWLEDAARETARQIVATGRGSITTSNGTSHYQVVPSTSAEVSYLREGPPEWESGLMVIGADQINEDFLTDHITFQIASAF